MPNVNLDSFEVDFDGALQKLADEVVSDLRRRTEGLNPDQLSRFYKVSSAERLLRLVKMGAPDIIVRREMAILAKRVRAERHSTGEKST